MPPRSSRRNSGPYAHSHSPVADFTPGPDAQTYRDLLIFEERLKQNAARLQKRKSKYETFLAFLCLSIVYLSYHVFLAKNEWLPLHYLNVGLLLVCVTSVVLFFASGMYSERIAYASKFVPQANRSLRSFNMYLNTRSAPRRSFLSFLKPDSKSRARPSRPVSPIEGNIPLPSPAASPSSTPTKTGSGSTRSASSGSSAIQPQRRSAIPPIPPSSNPRGELIFSSRVSVPFREGYERYRAAFERRRAEKLEAKRAVGWRKWLRMIGLGREAWKPPAPGMGSADEKAVGASAGGAHSRQSSVNEKHGAHAHAHAHGGHSTPTGLPRARTRSTTSNSDRSSRASSRGGSPARSPTGRHLRNLSGDGTNSAPGPPPLGQTHSPLAPAWDATTSGSSKTPLATPSTPERRGRSMEASFEDSRRRRGRAPKQSDRRHSVQQVEEEKEAASRPAPASAAASTSDQTTMPDANMHAVLDTANDRASSMSTLREPESEAESSPASAPASAPEEGSSSASPIPPSSAAPLSSSSSSDKRASRDSEEWVQVGPDGRGKSKGGLSRSSLRRSGGRGSEIDAGGGGKDL